jgi:mRNA interferase MazF
LDADDAVVAAVTSASPRLPSDVPRMNWRAAGLRIPSTARLSRLDCLEQILLLKKLGKLSAAANNIPEQTACMVFKSFF